MTARKQVGPQQVDPGAVLTRLTEWAAQFHDDSSRARVTDVLVAFAFVAGLRFAATGPAVAAAFLCRVEEEMPSTGKRARLLARALLDLTTKGLGGGSGYEPCRMRAVTRVMKGPSKKSRCGRHRR